MNSYVFLWFSPVASGTLTFWTSQDSEEDSVPSEASGSKSRSESMEQGSKPLLVMLRNMYIYKVKLLRIRFGYPELDFEILVYLHNI